MADVYSPPPGYPIPSVRDFLKDGHFDREGYLAAEEKYIETLRAVARQLNRGELVGETLSFPAADGYARYMIWKQRPFQLIHLPLGDAWQIPAAHARGLRLQDAREMLERAHKLAEFFSKKAS